MIDLEIDPVLPLKFIVKASMASMKVGVENAEWNDDLDLRIVREQCARPEEMDEVDVILHDPMEEWREHTRRTLDFLQNIDLQ